MTLCLANGERIKLNKKMHMVFEVEDLSVASPATVSRVGIVYLTPLNLGWRPYVISWVARECWPAEGIEGGPRMTTQLAEHVMKLFESSIDAGLDWIRGIIGSRELVPTVNSQLIESLCAMFISLLPNAKLNLAPQTALVVTSGGTITPVGAYQQITAAGAVGTSAITAGNAGDVLILINTGSNTITLTDTGTLKLGGNAALGPSDALALFSDGTNWIQVSKADN